MPIEHHEAYLDRIATLDELIDAAYELEEIERKPNVDPLKRQAAARRAREANERFEEMRARIDLLDS
jgi:butyrate kinase